MDDKLCNKYEMKLYTTVIDLLNNLFRLGAQTPNFDKDPQWIARGNQIPLVKQISCSPPYSPKVTARLKN
jgi:hypothetical protein